MKIYQTFKTKNRDRYLLCRCLNYWARNSNIIEIWKKLYDKIMLRIKKEKTDWVILNGIPWTIWLWTKFIPFKKDELTYEEINWINRLLEINTIAQLKYLFSQYKR